MDLVNCVITLGWGCMCREIKPSSSERRKIIENEYETEKKLHLNPIEWLFFVIDEKKKNL